MRFSQSIIIDPRKVLPSRHSVFIRGLPGSINVDSIKWGCHHVDSNPTREFFAKQADGKCKIDFFSYSDDNAHLFVAVRFASHNVARKLINRYDGERIFGHRVEINWFKDIRKARKKVIENKRKYQALLAQPHSECRRRFTSRFQPWRMNNRWNCNRASYRHFGSPTLRQCVSSGNSSESRSCSPPFRTRDRRSSSSSSSSTTSKESNQSKKFGRRSQKAYSTDSLSSSTLSMRSPTSGPKRTMRIPPYHYDEHTSEKEILQAALDACPIASEQNYRYSRSVSRHSKQQEPAIPTRQTSKSEHTTTPKDTIQRRKKHQKRKKRRRDRHSSSYRGKRSSASPCPELFDHKKTPEQNYSPPTNVTEIQDEDVHAMLEVEELSLEATISQRKLHHVLSPREPVQSRSSSEAEAGSSRSPEQEFPSTASVVAIEIPKMDQSSTEITETPLSPHDQSSENETKNFTIDLDVPEEGITDPVSKVDVGTQYLCSLSESNGFHDSLIQLALLTDTDVDEIFQRKRLIEAAYRLDCKSYTTSISELIRLNPDLKDRLLTSLRSLLEERAERSINELREFILKLRH